MSTATKTQTNAEGNSNATATLTQVVSTAPAKIEDNQHCISWSRRSTEKNPVKTEERYRGIVVNKATLTLPDGATTSKFSALLQSAIFELADKKFAHWAKDNMMVREVDASLFSLDAVLLFWAEEKKASQMDGDKITAFLKDSATLKTLDEKTAAIWLSKVPKIAAPSYANLFSKAQAATIAAKLAPADLEHPAAVFILSRCNSIIEKQSQEEAL